MSGKAPYLQVGSCDSSSMSLSSSNGGTIGMTVGSQSVSVSTIPSAPWTSGGFTINADGSISIAPGTHFWIGNGLLTVTNELYISTMGSIEAYQLKATYTDTYYVRGSGGSGSSNYVTSSGGTISLAGSGGILTLNGNKTFVIDHPTDPDRFLVHACLEGPEVAVFYRGEVRLDENGRYYVHLPDYFSALTISGSETVQVTPILDNEGDIFDIVAATRVVDGGFVIRGDPHQAVHWRVEATRKDAELIVTPRRDEVFIGGEGPYKWVVPVL